VIEDRFNLNGDEGCAQLYFGSLTKGLTGGGFLYTNKESISLGIVVGIGALMHSAPQLDAPQLMESFKQRPEVATLLAGGETVEYSAHTIPEGGFNSLPTLYRDGILLAGDAAGFALNMGIIVRGMDLAIASGAIAAEAIIEAKKQNDYSAKSLANYETRLKESFVMKDLYTFRNIWKILDNPRLFQKYPGLIAALLEDLMYIGSDSKPKLSSTIMKHARKNLLSLSSLRDLLGLLKA
jgi:electron transfer flavoprotein-quinone oxidoreductase